MLTVSRGGSMDHVISLVAFGVFVGLWAGFAYALVASQGSLDATWAWIGELPLIVQVVVWLLFLPVVAALWVWETGWPLVARLAVVAGLAIATIYAFLPRWLLGQAA